MSENSESELDAAISDFCNIIRLSKLTMHMSMYKCVKSSFCMRFSLLKKDKTLLGK